MQTQQVVSYYDIGREEAQFKGTQPKRKPLITNGPEARAALERVARKLGLMPRLIPDSFDFKPKPAEPRFSAGRAGMTFKNRAGERVAGLSIDLIDGGLNNYWFATWKAGAGGPSR